MAQLSWEIRDRLKTACYSVGGASEVKNSEEREMATLGYKVIKRADA